MPECGYCKDCRHWTKRSHAVWWNPDPEPDEPIDTRMFCALAESVGGGPENALAYGIDADERYAGLVTMPDYGCVQFEPKST